MNIDKKNKAVKLISKALAIQYIPSLIWGSLVNIDVISEDSTITLISLVISLVLFVYAYFPLIKACSRYSESKGYSAYLGGFGLLSSLGVFILSVIPPKDYIVDSEGQTEKNSFDYINLIEIFVLYIINPLFLFFISIVLGVLFVAFTDYNYGNSESENLLMGSIYLILVSILILTNSKFSGFKIRDFIPNLQLNWNSTIKITVFYSIFRISFYRLIGYSLSFIFPDYMENLINGNRPMSLNLYLSLFLLVLLLQLFFNGFLLIGIILQKISIKYGNTKGILILSIILSLTAMLPFPPYFIDALLFYMIISILFFKTANLLNCIIFIIFSRIFINIASFLVFGFNFSFISISEYQQKVEPWLMLYLIMTIISLSLIIKFIYKNFPKQNDIIPYYRNKLLS